PDDAPDGLIDGLTAMEETLGDHAVEEAAMAVPGERAQRALEQAVEASKESPILANVAVAHTVDSNALKEASAVPWQLGERAASMVRDTVGMHRGPILDHAFSDILRVR